jgi:hypothetical protein
MSREPDPSPLPGYFSYSFSLRLSQLSRDSSLPHLGVGQAARDAAIPRLYPLVFPMLGGTVE